jgi:hypothetical protein
VLSFGSAPADGTYYATFTFAGIPATQSITLSEGDAFVFDLSLLNEQADYQFAIYDNTGAVVRVDIDGVECDCFTFETKFMGYIADVTPTMEEDILLQENGFYLLQENGGNILL